MCEWCTSRNREAFCIRLKHFEFFWGFFFLFFGQFFQFREHLMHSFLNWEVNSMEANRACLVVSREYYWSTLRRQLFWMKVLQTYSRCVPPGSAAHIWPPPLRVTWGGRFWWDFEVPRYFRKQLPQTPEKFSRKNSFSGFFFQVNAICFYTGGRYLLV